MIFYLWFLVLNSLVLITNSRSVTYSQEEAFSRLVGYEGSFMVNLSLDFRTYQGNGVILYHKFSSEGFIKIYLNQSQISAILQYSEVQPIILQFNQMMNEGSWHKLGFFLNGEAAILKLDGESLMSTIVKEVRTGSYYDIGGGLHGEVGFRGCLRNLVIDGKPRELETEDGVQVGCALEDTCGCRHGGICFKDVCNCTGTGYSGTTCGISLNPTSCTQVFESINSGLSLDIPSSYIIDLDGSGQLKPVTVKCSIRGEEIVTTIEHDNEEDTKIDGFQEPGSFKQNIHYHAPWEFIEELVNISSSCSQYLRYDCKESRLLEGGAGWWVSSTGERMENWPGDPAPFSSQRLPPFSISADLSSIHPSSSSSSISSGICGCGVDRTCFNSTKSCNCDSQSSSWQSDGGFINSKKNLPVAALFFGDTGTPFDNKEARFSLGPLMCTGHNANPSASIQELDDKVYLDSFPTEMSTLEFEFKTKGYQGNLFQLVLLLKSKDTQLVDVRVDCGENIANSNIIVNRKVVFTALRLCDDKWHSVILERSHLGVFIGLDRTKIYQDTTSIPRALRVQLGGKDEMKFSGSLKLVKVDSDSVDLVSLIQQVDAVHPCSGQPCKNGGVCTPEGDKPICDCSKVPYQGEFCEFDLGLSFAAEESFSLLLANQSINLRSVLVGVSTKSREGTILSAKYMESEVFRLSINRMGQLSLTYHLGRKYTVFILESSYRNQDFHLISIKVDDDGRSVKVVDGLLEKVYELGPLDWKILSEVQSLHIGGGISGCISSLVVGDIIVLKHFNIVHSTSTQYCDIESRSRSSQSKYFSSSYSVEVVANSLVLGLGVSLLVVLISLVLLTSIRCMRRHKGGYYTREDEGELGAKDPDTAVLRGVTGCKVERRREWIL
ncbi:neurexin-4 isoform X2 [Eurytemora carolleeae]|uniref:neurexin-4 isoform X2 n=1 Tax=Eurytemora carolleeae TaxID=1294199 RepID=UPI000C76630B|nr:neurexin-4 isoform X2 [Eurytemora carolleeae]|eukprot:XP_023338889.1 neurexin-4-like isoform X2 [Eurytemora affinis]